MPMNSPSISEPYASTLDTANSLESQLRSLEYQCCLARALYEEKTQIVQALEEELVSLLIKGRTLRSGRSWQLRDA